MMKNAAITRARNEIAEEQVEKDVLRLKVKYRELEAAEKVVRNIQAEVDDLEISIEVDSAVQ
jgi:hypothetical protein